VLKPLFDKHSIEAVTLLCEFTADIDKAGLDFIRGESKLLQRKLPYRRVKRRGVLGAAVHDLSAAQPEVLGFMFLQKTLDEETEIFEISGERASFTSKAYSNFESFFADSSFFLEKANDAFSISGAKLKRVMLRYKDAFSSKEIDWEPYESLRQGSPYLPVPVIKKGDFWHCEAGFFVHSENEDVLLNNYRVEHTVVQNEEDAGDFEFFLNIYLTHLLESKALREADSFTIALRDVVDKLRKEHRIIFSGILSDDLSARIGLLTPEQES
jgi:uncharacterized protein (TIGR04255 family)